MLRNRRRVAGGEGSGGGVAAPEVMSLAGRGREGAGVAETTGESLDSPSETTNTLC